MTTQPHQPPESAALLSDIYFRDNDFDADSRVDTHAHSWGQLNYSVSGVMEINISGKRYLSSPQYAIWVPPETPHDANIRQKVIYRSAYIDASLCAMLPEQPCVMVINALLKAILADFARRKVTTPDTPADKRLAQVLIDQLRLTSYSSNYLPDSDDPVLAALLNALQSDPGCDRSLAEWARQLHVTERTLARRCLRDLGMSFSEWRQRQRFLAALPQLQQGKSVQTVALDLGYSTSSAFIAMFRRQSGSTPDRFRRGLDDFSEES